MLHLRQHAIAMHFTLNCVHWIIFHLKWQISNLFVDRMTKEIGKLNSSMSHRRFEFRNILIRHRITSWTENATKRNLSSRVFCRRNSENFNDISRNLVAGEEQTFLTFFFSIVFDSVNLKFVMRRDECVPWMARRSFRIKQKNNETMEKATDVKWYLLTRSSLIDLVKIYCVSEILCAFFSFFIFTSFFFVVVATNNERVYWPFWMNAKKKKQEKNKDIHLRQKSCLGGACPILNAFISTSLFFYQWTFFV